MTVRICAGVIMVLHQHAEAVNNTVRIVHPAVIICYPVCTP